MDAAVSVVERPEVQSVASPESAWVSPVALLHRLTSWCRGILLSFAFVSTLVAGLAAQAPGRIVGTITDAVTGRPVGEATVAVVRSDLTARSDAQGLYILDGVVPGLVKVLVQAIGYHPITSPYYTLLPDSTVVADFRLAPLTVQLDPVVVEGEVERFAPGPLRGFYQRKRRGWGTFLTREEIEQKQPVRTTDIFRGIAGVRVVPIGGSRYQVIMASAPPSWIPGRGCPVKFYLDGIRLPGGDYIDDLVLASNVEAVEVYRRASETPAEFLGSDSRCGVMVIWTKRSP